MSKKENNDNEFEPYKINKNDILFFSRIIPNCGLYEILELKIRTVMPTYFAGSDMRTKQSFLFDYGEINKTVFKDRKEALRVVKAAEKNKREVI